jgi:hypothetical protein
MIIEFMSSGTLLTRLTSFSQIGCEQKVLK